MNMPMLLLLAATLGSTTAAHAQADSLTPPTDCTVELRSGRKIAVDRFWRVEQERVEYEHKGSLHDLATSEILTIQCGATPFTILNDTLCPVLTPVPQATLPDQGLPTTRMAEGAIDYRALGKADAKLYYGGEGNFVAGMLTAPLIIPPLIIAGVPPTPSLKNNPNAQLYFTRPEYRKGYRGVAHGKKAGLTIGGMTVGLVLLAMIAAAGI